jgi:hypothetical protein
MALLLTTGSAVRDGQDGLDAHQLSRADRHDLRVSGGVVVAGARLARDAESNPRM